MTLSTRKTLIALALKLLSRREHSVFELTEKLKDKTDCPELIPEIIQELIQKKYLDDNRFAEMYIRMRQNRGYGPLRIIQELKQRGILDPRPRLRGDDSGDDNLREIREKKFGRKLPETLLEKAKQIRFLQYRGFSFEDINKVLKHDEDDR